MINVSVSAWSVQEKLYANEISLIDFFGFCRENGVKYVELLDCFINGKYSFKEIKDTLEKYELKVSAYSVINDFVQSNAEERKKQVEWVMKGIDDACFLGARTVRLFTGDPKDGISFDAGKLSIIKCFEDLVKYAGKRGVLLVLENHGVFAGKSGQIKEIVDTVSSPYLKINFDTGNFLCVDEEPVDAYLALRGYVGFVHFKDYRKVGREEPGYFSLKGLKYNGTVLGKGEIDLKKIAGLLSEDGYNGYFSIEYESENGGDCLVNTRRSIAYTKELVKAL